MELLRHRWAILLLAVGLVAAACTSNTNASKKTTTPSVKRGGIYRTAASSFGLTDNLDPTGEYQTGFAWEIYAATIRTLVTYRHIAGPAGTVVVPDLATTVPQPSADGLTYTFHLKPGVKFAPPLNREVTSSDIAYAFQRINTRSLAAQYGFYFDGVIQGMTGDATSPDQPISGIQTPNPQTIIFHLTRPTGDFLYRVALPAAGPIPPEVGKCFSQPGQYGRDLISSGPYMLQGSPSIDISSCATIKAMSGFDPTSHIILVRNPNYLASTDSPTDRANYVNGVDITLDTNVGDIFAKIQAGQLDGSIFDSPPAATLEQYVSSPSLRKDVHSTPINQLEALAMNLSVPPFDDVHVRRAVNYIMNKASIQAELGGPYVIDIATHILPPNMVQGALTSAYNPYATPGNAGSLSLAEAQMKLSRYDPKHDGKCDIASVCNKVLMINASQFASLDPTIIASLAKIGINVVARNLETGAAFTTIETSKNQVPLAPLGGGYADYADGYGYAEALFASGAIGTVGCCNYSMVGLTRSQAAKLGLKYPSQTIPSADSYINKCEALSGSPRVNCWVAFDKYMMETIVPYVPYEWGRNVTITGPTVTKFVIDQSTGAVSLTQIAVSNNASA